MSELNFSAVRSYAKSAYTIPTQGGPRDPYASSSDGPANGRSGTWPSYARTCVGNNRNCSMWGDVYHDTGLVTFACIFGMLAVLSGYYVYRRRAKLEHGMLLLFLLCSSRD